MPDTLPTQQQLPLGDGQQPPARPPTPPAPPPAAPQLSEKQKLLAELGFENVENDDDGFSRVVAALKQERENQGKLSKQVQDALEQLRQQDQLPQGQGAPAQPQGSGWVWSPPQVDINLASQYRTADGWKDGTPAHIRQKFEEYEQYKAVFANTFLSDPEKALSPLMEKKFDEYFDRKFGQVTQQNQEKSAQAEVYSANPWLFEKDPLTGKPDMRRLSNEGQLLNQFFVRAQEMGVPSFMGCWEYAKAMHDLAKAQSQQKPPAAETDDDKRKAELLRRANGGVNPPRGGSLPPAGATNPPAQNRNLRFGQRLAANAKANGVAFPS